MDNFGEVQQLWDHLNAWGRSIDWGARLAAVPTAVIEWTDWTLLIDAFGLGLAILGFFNLTPKLEAYFRNRMAYSQEGLEVMTERFRALWPIHRNWRLFWDETIGLVQAYYKQLLLSVAFAVPVTILIEG